MTGIICMWSGAIVDIPDGWLLCDGNNGTPDLTDRFIVGAGDTYAVDAVGGSSQHRHIVSGNTEDGGGAHKHLSDADTGGVGFGGSNYADVGGAKEAYPFHNHSIVDWTSVPDVLHDHSQNHNTNYRDHRPSYWALAFIMKT